MRLKIWTIDDETFFFNVLEEKFKIIQSSLGIELQIKCFPEYEGTEHQPDLWILDIDMPVNGFEISKLLNAPYIFMSSHDNYVYESFDYEPYAFVRKDHIEEDLGRALKRFVNDRENRIKIQYNNTEINLSVGQILRMYKDKNYLVIVTVNKEYKIKISINVFLDQYSRIIGRNMIRISRSELINPKFITKTERNCFVLKDGSVCYPSRLHRKEASRQALEFVVRNDEYQSI